jgi:ABC-type antimicrobial peptide transport system permease subunit
MAVNVRRRTREIGVRRALGSPSAGIVLSLFERSAKQWLLGVAIGLGCGIPLAGFLDRAFLQFGNYADPAVLLGAAGLMGIATALAVLVPARRALLLDPNEALRQN